MEYQAVADEVQVAELEEQLKKFLTGKFEDERLASVKKTTNWNILVTKDLRQLLVAEEDFKLRYLDDVKDELRPENDFAPLKAAYEKAFPSGQLKEALIDFEDYMLYSRKGGTISKMREKQAKDEDIRSRAVQEYLKLIGEDHGKEIWGVPINTLMTSEDQIWEELKSVRLHEVDDHYVEFALSVLLKPYPGNVFSVWLFITMFKEKQEIRK